MLITAITAFLGFTTTISAIALPHSWPTHKDSFSLAVEVNGAYLPLIAVNNGTTDLVLQADQTGDVKYGTLTYTNTTNTSTTTSTNTNGYNTSLLFDLTHTTDCTPGVYGVAVSDPGELYGVSLRVNAVLGYQEFNFDVVDDSVYHSLTSAFQHWFACLDTVNGTEGYFLSWGLFTREDAAPDGCVVTSVVQTFWNSTAT